MNRTIKGVLLLASGCILLWLASDFFLFYRDNFSTHFPVQSAMENLVQDGLPLWNPLIDGGQPLAGNPNNLTFYPTTLLYLLLPSHLAFNLHFILHLFVAWFGMKRLLEVHDVSSRDSSLVATLYLLSGAVVSCLVFYNLIVAAALMPWALASLIRLLENRRPLDALCLGALCGLLGLAAEPAMIGGFAAVSLAVFATRRSRKATVLITLSVLVAITVAAPQLIAYLEISGETERAHYPFSAASSLAASLDPARLAEMITGPIHGSVLDHSANGYWRIGTSRKWPPFFMSILMSALFLPALMRRSRELVPYQLLVALFLFLAIGSFNPIVEELVASSGSLRFIRYPEKFALLITLITSILVGGLFRDLGRKDLRRQGAASLIVVAGVTAVVLIMTSLTPAARVRILLISLLQMAGISLLVFPERFRPTSRLLAGVAAVPLLIWALQIVPVDDEQYYTTPSPIADVTGREIIAVSAGDPDPSMFAPSAIYRYYAFRLNPSFGIRYGVPYALSGSPEGMHSYLSRLSAERFRMADPAAILHYLRIHGVTFLIRAEPVEAPGLDLVSSWRGLPLPVLVYEVPEPRPFLWEPSNVLPAATATDAVRIIESQEFDPSTDTVVPGWLAPSLEPPASSTIRLLYRDSQKMSFEVRARRDTIIIVNQSWFPAWKARTSDEELATFPADIDRLGISVPAGLTTVHIEFGRYRTLIAAALVLSAMTLLYTLGAAIVSRTRIAEPAR